MSVILIASLLGGSIIGYRTGADRRGTRLFLYVWLATFVFQTIVLLTTADNPRHRDTGAWDLGYFPFSAIVLLVGLAILHAATWIRRRRTRGAIDLAG